MPWEFVANFSFDLNYDKHAKCCRVAYPTLFSPEYPLWKCEKNEPNLINSSLAMRQAEHAIIFIWLFFFNIIYIFILYFGKWFGVGVVSVRVRVVEVICSVSATFGRLHARAAVTPPVLTWTLSVLRWGKVSVFSSVSNSVKSQSTPASFPTHVCVIVSVCTLAGSRRFCVVHSCFIYSILYLYDIQYRGVRTCIVYKFMRFFGNHVTCIASPDPQKSWLESRATTTTTSAACVRPLTLDIYSL